MQSLICVYTVCICEKASFLRTEQSKTYLSTSMLCCFYDMHKAMKDALLMFYGKSKSEIESVLQSTEKVILSDTDRYTQGLVDQMCI